MRFGFAAMCFSLAFATLFWAMACNTTGIGGGDGAGDGTDGAALQVTDDLREACPGESDAEIRQAIDAAERAREEGTTQQAALAQVDENCAASDEAHCRACGRAIVNYVYRNADGGGAGDGGGGNGGGDDDWGTDGGDWGTDGGDWGTDGGNWGTNGGDWGTDGGDWGTDGGDWGTNGGDWDTNGGGGFGTGG